MPAVAKSSGPGAEGECGPPGIGCGVGPFRVAVAEAVKRRGRPVVLLALRGFADPGVERFPHEWMPFGAFGTSVTLARKHGVGDLVVIGSVLRPKLLDFRLDWTTFRILPRLRRA